MALDYDQYIDQGTTFSSAITVNGVDLSDATISAQLRKNYNSTEYSDFEIIPIDLANGEFAISLSANITSSIKSGRFVYDVLYSINGIAIRIVQGIVTIKPQVTRPSITVEN